MDIQCMGFPWGNRALLWQYWIIALEGVGTPRKKLSGRLRFACMTHSEEPRAAGSSLRLPNETDYLFGDFVP